MGEEDTFNNEYLVWRKNLMKNAEGPCKFVPKTPKLH